MNNTPQRKRWVAAASCVGLVAVIAGGGYWSNYVYLSDLTALDAWNRYMDLVKDGKYNDAVRYFPELATLFDGQFQHDFLRDAAHAHAPSKVTFEGRAVPNKSTEKEGIWTEIAGTVRFNDRASDSYSFSSYLKETTRRNGQLGMWKIGACQFFCVWGLEVGGDSVGVGGGELGEGLFPVGGGVSLDEAGVSCSFVGGFASVCEALGGSFVFDVADGEPQEFDGGFFAGEMPAVLGDFT